MDVVIARDYIDVQDVRYIMQKIQRLLVLPVIAFAISAYSQLPPPPLPPQIADAANVRSAIRTASLCVEGRQDEMDHDGENRARSAVRRARAPLGSPAWNTAKAVVEDFVLHRRAEKKCLEELERFRYSTAVSNHDRVVLEMELRGLQTFWVSRSPFEAAIIAELVDKKLATDSPGIAISPY